MRKNKAMIFWFCLPALLSLVIMFVYPVCRTVVMSFFQVESVTASMSDWSFYGLGNYTKIFGSASFLTSISIRESSAGRQNQKIIALFFCMIFTLSFLI